MDNLTLDAEALFAIADIIDGYCAKQRETINVYYAQIMALESEWRDDETFGGIAEELRKLKINAVAVLDEVYNTYPKYFRSKAQHILERPVMNGGSVEPTRVIEELRVPPNVVTHTSINTTPIKTISTDAQIATITQRGNATSFAKIVDFSNFDHKVANVMVEAMESAKKDFPGLKINYFGSISNQVSIIHSELAQSKAEQLKNKHGNELSDSDYLILGNKFADEVISKWKLNNTDRTIAWSLNIPKSADPTNGRLEKCCGIAINDVYAGDDEIFTEKKKQEVLSKHKPIGCDTPKATADHEIGHEIDRMLSARNDKEIIALYEEFIESEQPENELSGYAKTNIAEFIAEAYSEYRNNPKPRTYAVKVYNRLIELQQRRVYKNEIE